MNKILVDDSIREGDIGFRVLRMSDVPVKDFTLSRLAKEVEEYKPHRIYINKEQSTTCCGFDGKDLVVWRTFRGIPLSVENSDE